MGFSIRQHARPQHGSCESVTLVTVTTVPGTMFFFRGHAAYLKEKHIVMQAVAAPGSRLEEFAQIEKVDVHAIPMTRRMSPLRDLVALLKFRILFRKLCPQIVHSHTPKGGLLGMIAAWLARVPVRIYHVHGLPMMTKSGWRYELLRITEKIACSLSHQVLCVSPSVRDVVIESGLCRASKIKVLARGTINGVDASMRFSPTCTTKDAAKRLRQECRIPREATVIGYLGRLVRDKGIAELATSWQRLRLRFPSLHLIIGGVFEDGDPVSSHVRQILEKDDRIHLLGQVEDTPAFLEAIDVLVLPTYREGFPTVPLEAAAMEVPVVTTRVPGCVDAVQDGVTGTLVPVNDAEAFAGAIERYLNDPELRRQHGQAGRARVLRDFQPEVVWEAIYQEYVSLLKEKGLPVPEVVPTVTKKAA